MSYARGTIVAIATLIAGVVIGGIGFLRFAQQAASANNALMLEVAGRQASGTLAGQDATLAAPVAASMLSGIVFAIGTPLGWLATYLTVTGLVRSVSAAVGETHGDPLIAGMRAVVRSLKRRRATRAAIESQAALAGPEVADRVVEPSRLGLSGIDLVVVASRPKPDWTPGTVLECGDRWLRVGDAVERTLPQGLRTLYPLVEMRELDVFRRVIPYDLPATLK